jgi:hypothetical protein
MRSRPARLTLSALVWTCLGAAAFLTFHLQQQIDGRRAALKAFEATSRDATDALADAQAGQQAYVAPGQDLRDWGGKVATYLETASSSVNTLQKTARSLSAGPSLLDAGTALTQILSLDGRLHKRLAGGSVSEASAVIYSEAAAAFSSAVSDIDTALASEQQASEQFDASQQRLQMYALGGGAAIAALVVALLGLASPVRPAESTAVAEQTQQELSGLSLRDADQISSPEPRSLPPALEPEAPAAAVVSIEALDRAAEVCDGFGRVRDASDLTALLEQAAGVLNARGLIVWLGSAAGADLQPVLAHGYSDATLARLSSIARTADNAAASAYRTGALQIVKSRPGGSQGAVVAPLVGPDGCIGALTAEIRDRQEDSDTTRAFARIVASQLAAVLAPAAAAAEDAGASSAAATASQA